MIGSLTVNVNKCINHFLFDPAEKLGWLHKNDVKKSAVARRQSRFF